MKSKCSVDGCERPACARGWCPKHYATNRSYGNPNYPVRDRKFGKRRRYKKPKAKCIVEGCERYSESTRLLCTKHYHKIRLRECRMKIIEHYGGKCECCGETRYEFLAIDHINGDGQERRKKGNTLEYFGIVKNNFEIDYPIRILCHNCNLAYGFYGYCPHQTQPVDRLLLPLFANQDYYKQN